MHQWWWEPWASRLNYWFIDCPRKRRSRHWLMGREEEGSKVVQGNLGRGGKDGKFRVVYVEKPDSRPPQPFAAPLDRIKTLLLAFLTENCISPRLLPNIQSNRQMALDPINLQTTALKKKIKKTHRCWGVGACGRCGLPSPISENLQLNKWTINLKGRVRGAAAGGTCCGAPETPDRHLFPILLFFRTKTANQQIGLPNSLEASEAAAAVHHETGETKERIIGATSGHR